MNRAQKAALKLHPHPRLRRGLSRNKAGEANNRWRGTRHPKSTLTFILALAAQREDTGFAWAKLSEILPPLAMLGSSG